MAPDADADTSADAANNDAEQRRQAWEERYGSNTRMWSGRANLAVIKAVSALAPGRALDLGSGEGADAIWLAQQGWSVTGVDISSTALQRAAEDAAVAGIGLDGITWVQADLATWSPPHSYDLVTASFLHTPEGFDREGVLRRASNAVAPGGHLLVVSHSGTPPWADPEAHHHHEHMPTVDDELKTIDPEGTAWRVEIAEVRRRTATGPDGEPAELEDNVVLLRRPA